MKSNILFWIEFVISFLPFVLFAFFNGKSNVKKENRNRQYPMPIIAVVYSVTLLIFLDKLAAFIYDKFILVAVLFDKIHLPMVGNFIRDIYTSWGIYLELVLFNTAALVLYVIAKRILTLIIGRIKIPKNTFVRSMVELFYSYDELDDCWYIKEHYGQARTFIKVAYYGSCFISGVALFVSCGLCMNNLISAPFYPVFAVIIIGELAFFIDGISADEKKASFEMQSDSARHIAMYPLLRKPLRLLFGDKLAAEGTTVNNGGMTGGALEDILVDLEKNGKHIGANYAMFIRNKMENGLKPNVDYLRCGYDLSVGKSLLFNTPFYDKLNPYIFYAMNRELLTGGKILIVLGRHGTEDDLLKWSSEGMKGISNIPDLWKIRVITGEKTNEDDLPDIGIITRSGVHSLDIHKNNLAFLRKVSFVFMVEPSKLVTTAQIGLNLLVKCCGKERDITFCSVDRNCDGLVDALSHILMTNITEVSATEYPHGMSSYMYWTSDEDYLQHRILPGISRSLGMGTEFSMVALKNQVEKTIWYGSEAYPVRDVHWIAKQYYYDLLNYAQLPTNQETFDKCFRTSINMCDERVGDNSFITVEDDRNNLFETRRNFATVTEQQGFVNVISSEYMLREYMSSNSKLFLTDAKAIPYITADYARTKRNSILTLCLLLCIDSVKEEVLLRQLVMLNIDTKDPISAIWEEICTIFGKEETKDKDGNAILSFKNSFGVDVSFEKDSTILFTRAYDIESGKFESVYTIENENFSRIILNDLQNASYIAEQEDRDIYIGTELKGHVYQKYLPGQFFTLNGKYYEMISNATDNRILVRRASEHIGGRLAYRQIRNYTLHKIEDSSSMGALKSVNNIDIHYQFADFSVETPGYWKLHAHNDFDDGDVIMVNGVPKREYFHKQILKFDFSKLGDAFTDSVRMTLTNLLNEIFVTLFAENQPFISAVTPGQYDAPLTYSLAFGEEVENTDKCIFILEDSQLDIGLLIAVERNIERIFQIIADYLAWNDEQIEESLRKQDAPTSDNDSAQFDVYAEDGETKEKKGFFGRIASWFKGLFKKNKKAKDNSDRATSEDGDNLTPRQRKKAEKAAKRAEKQAKKQAEKERKQAEKEQRQAEKEAKKLAKKQKQADEQVETEEAVENQPSEADSSEETIESDEAQDDADSSEEAIEADEAQDDADSSEEAIEADEAQDDADSSKDDVTDLDESQNEVEVSENE